ncbi:Trm112 family protein [Streptomyces qinzhouensis]|uniref:Trm112 family protein n=1 Tax=Streptomyces qinzhouensis TaxID=2599401 RepID=A0A5B8JEL9_9ACTN|nr:Trm112 family protein [Streptomyces qinzhouensis]QDY80057.1 Trm112 family protein [Streptomyces qinzhouensis]
MNADDPLLGILVCPLDKGPLRLVMFGAGPAALAVEAGDALYNPRLRRLYPVVNGVPRLCPASGRTVSDEEHTRLTRQGAAAPGPAGDAPGAGTLGLRS